MRQLGIFDEVERQDDLDELERRYTEGCERTRMDYYFSHCQAPVLADYGTTKEVVFKGERTTPFTGGGKRGKIYKFSEASAARFQRGIRRSNIRFLSLIHISEPTRPY